MRRTFVGFLTIGIVAVLAFVVGNRTFTDTAQADNPIPLIVPVVEIDPEPSTNTATSVGTVEQCWQYNGVTPFPFDVDIVLPGTGVPAFDGHNGDITNHSYDIAWAPDLVDATATGAAGQGLLEKSGGGAIPVPNGYAATAASPQSNAFNDLGATTESGPGTLDKLTFTATANGIVTLSFGLGTVIVGDKHSPVPENMALPASGTVIGNALVAINTPCPEGADMQKVDSQIHPLYGCKTDDGTPPIPQGTGLPVVLWKDIDGDTNPEPFFSECAKEFYFGVPLQPPYNGDDDGDGLKDEDPKDGVDNDGNNGIDEDPFGFLGLDNDGDTLIDEDGTAPYDYNGDTIIDPTGCGFPTAAPPLLSGAPQVFSGAPPCENHVPGFSDDGDPIPDEDEIDADVSTDAWFILKELYRNNGPANSADGDVTIKFPAIQGVDVSFHCGIDDILLNATVGLDTDGDTDVDQALGPCTQPSQVFYASAPDVLVVNKDLDNMLENQTIQLLQQFDVHCTEPSNHTLSITDRIDIDPNDPSALVGDGVNNNSKTNVLELNCIGQSDLKHDSYQVAGLDLNGDTTVDTPLPPAILSGNGFDEDGDSTADEDPIGDCNADGQLNDDFDGPGDDSDPNFVDEDGGTCVIVVVDKVIHNNGPFGPTGVQAVAGGAVLAPPPGALSPFSPQAEWNPAFNESGGAPDGTCFDTNNNDGLEGADYLDSDCLVATPANCTLTALQPQVRQIPNVPVSAPGVDADEKYILECGLSTFQDKDDDGDLSFDEDPPDGFDQDGDTLVDEDPPFDVVILGFQNFLKPKDPHVFDPDMIDLQTQLPTNNLAETGDSLIAVMPFVPDGSATIDDDVVPSNPGIGSLPFDDICLILVACEQLFHQAIPAGQPLALGSVWVPTGIYTIAGGNAVADGTLMAVTSGKVTLALNPSQCNDPKGGAEINFVAALTDGMLPVAFGGSNDVTGGLLDDDTAWPTEVEKSSIFKAFNNGAQPFAGLVDAGSDADTIEDATGGFPALHPGGDLRNLLVAVDSDNSASIQPDEVKKITSNDGDTLNLASPLPENPPAGVFYTLNYVGAPLHARYVGNTGAPLNIEVNVLVFLAPDPDTSVLSYVHASVTGDPTNPSGNELCTPFESNTNYAGETAVGANDLRQCNIQGPNDITIRFTRADTGSTTTILDPNECSSEGKIFMAKDEDPGDELAYDETADEDGAGANTCFDGLDNVPGDGADSADSDCYVPDSPGDRVHVSTPTTRTVHVDTTGPTSMGLKMSIIGPPICNPRWFSSDVGPTTPLLPDANPSIIIPPVGDAFQISVVTVANAGQGHFHFDYEVHCEAPGDYELQIIANITDIAGDPTDDQAENHPVVHAVADWDGDTIVSADNCPNDQNPNQADNDGDGIGDVCDPDDDNDGIDDGPDECNFVAEDDDDIDDEDGCPDTQTSITHTKEETYQVDVSVATTKTVTITVSNDGNVAANLRVTVLALSKINPGCEVRLVAKPGDTYAEWVANEDLDGSTVAESILHSQLEWIESLAAGKSRVVTRDYVIHCFVSSDQLYADSNGDGVPDKTFLLETGVVPLLPVREGDADNNGTADVEDNKLENFPLVTAIAKADIKVTGDAPVITQPPVVNQAFELALTGTLHNNGPAPLNQADTQLVIAFPADCTLTLLEDSNGPLNPVEVFNTSPLVHDNQFSLPVSVVQPLSAVIEIVCTEPSLHTFSGSIDAGVGDVHVEDPDPSNNSFGPPEIVIPFVANVSVDVEQVVSAPAVLLVGATGQITVDKTITYTGDLPSVAVTVNKTVTPSTDKCFVMPPADTFQLTLVNNVPAQIQEVFNVDCIIKGNFSFTVTNTVSVKDPNVHILGIKSDSDTDSVDILSGMDAVALGVGVVDPETGECNINPQTPDEFRLIQSHMTPLRFCELEDNLAGGNIPVIYKPVPLGGLPDPATLTHPNPLKQLEQVNIFEKKILFNEPGKWHCISTLTPSRCSVSTFDQQFNLVERKVPFSTLIWKFDLASAGPVCVVLEPNVGFSVVAPCFLDIEKFGMKVIWTERDHNLQRKVINEIWWFQEDWTLMPPQWEEEMLSAVPQFVLDELANGGYSYNPGGGDLGPDSPGPLTLSMELLMLEEFDVDNSNDSTANTAIKIVRPDSDADSIPDDQDPCPDNPDPGSPDRDGDTVPDACDDDPDRPPHDVGVKDRNFLIIGPAPLNLSDTVGRYEWIIAEIGNFSGPPKIEKVTLSLNLVKPAALDDCEAMLIDGPDADNDPTNDGDGVIVQQIIPGQNTFLMAPEEQKFVVWRIRFECHAPVPIGTYDVTETVTVTHDDLFDGGQDGNPANDSKTATKTIVIN